MHNLQIDEQGSTSQVQDLPSKFFYYKSLNARSQENQYQQATFEDQVPTFYQPSAALDFQETNSDNAYITTWSSPNEPLEVCPRGT